MLSQPVVGRKKVVTILLALCFLFYVLDFFIRLAPGVFFSLLANQYQLTPISMSFFSSLFYLGYLTVQVPCGILLTKQRFQRLIASAIIVCALSLAIFAYTHSLWIAYIMRFIMGVSSGFSFIAILFIAKEYYPKQAFPLISGIAISIGTIAGSLIQVSAAALLKHISWQMILFFIAMAGAILAFVILFPAMSLRTKSVVAKKTGVREDILLFLKSKALILNSIEAGLLYLPTTLFATLWGVPFLHLNHHISLIAASTAVSFLFAGWGVGAPIIGLLCARWKRELLLIRLGTLFATAVCLLLLMQSVLTAYMIYTLLFLLGFFSSVQTVVWQRFNILWSGKNSGIGIAMSNTVIMLLASISHFLVGWVVDLHLLGSGQLDCSRGLWIMPTAFLIALGLTAVKQNKAPNVQHALPE